MTYTCFPAITYENILSTQEACQRSAPLGRAEATIALQSLLIACVGKAESGAVNITDGRAFPWTRFLQNTVSCKEYVGPGLERVYAIRSPGTTAPALLLCRADGSYVELRFQNGKTVKTVQGPRVQWRMLPILTDAKYISVPWMEVRQGLVVF